MTKDALAINPNNSPTLPGRCEAIARAKVGFPDTLLRDFAWSAIRLLHVLHLCMHFIRR
ncbi:MAG: hypothetical protein JWM16_5035 [Verrucomicrobiales bacterium]|nr:hypothetical protein [Verrucomicrobiales bacterium]